MAQYVPWYFSRSLPFSIMAPVETEKQQRIDEKSSGSPDTRTADNSNGQYKYSKYKVGVVISIAQTANSSFSPSSQSFPGIL